MRNEEKVENSRFQTGESPFVLLNDTQWRYITAMTENPSFSKKEGAEYVGIQPSTVYNWAQNAPHVEQALDLARKDIHSAAIEMRKHTLLKALRVKIALLDSDDEGIRSRVASELIEWELGKATQPTENKNTGEMAIRLILDDGTDAPDYA